MKTALPMEPPLTPKPKSTLRRTILLAATIVSVGGALLLPASVPPPAQAAAPSTPAATPSVPSATPASQPRGARPVLAYYYMWFSATSWTHKKSDVPTLGPYDSTDPAVIAQHVAWAKASGVDAFIASWKNTPPLDKALAALVAECHRQGLKLVLIYEGLDVNRNPIPVATVGADLAWFLQTYGSDPAFDLYGKPAVVWSGSWKFTDTQIAGVRAQLGAPDRLLLLGSEKDGAAYKARASLFDGDAYYWSSGDPLATPGYQTRLNDLAAAVHSSGGLWLAPAAVGFDGPQNGGATVVDRRNGATLTAAWNDAVASGPDGIAVISWNEFTEASYVEPSTGYGLRYLQVLAGLTGAPGPADATQPSASTASPSASPTATPTATPSATPAPPAATPAPSGPRYGAAVGRGSAPYEGLASLLVALLVIGGLVVLGFNLRKRPPGAVDADRPADG